MYSSITPAITTVEEVLDGVAGVREQTRLLERSMVVFAVEWAKHNPIPPPPQNYDSYGKHYEQWVFDELRRHGAAAFDATAVAEFAIAAGLTEYSATKLIVESLMLVHLLPRVWSRVLKGGVEVWRARHLAGDCVGLTAQAIEFVDQEMSQSTARITVTTRERIIDEARTRFMPEEAVELEEGALASRCVEVLTHDQQNGVASIFGRLDLPDAMALENAISAGAQALKELGSDAPLNTRRAWALGDLARAASGASSSRPQWDGKGALHGNVKLFLHLPSSTFDGDAGVGTVEAQGLAGHAVVDPDIIRSWFTRPTCSGHHVPTIMVRPVLDLENEKHTTSYQPPERTVDQVRLSHGTCVFPFCTRVAHRCDLDHNQPWKPGGQGGATCTCNLAPLCRTHHRLKTHGDNASTTSGKHSVWTYTNLGGQEYFWSGPRGMSFIRTNHGTFNASPTRNDGAVDHPGLYQQRGVPPPVDLADDAHRERTEDLIGRLLAKAATPL